MWEPNNPVYYKAKSIYEFRVTDLAGNHVLLDTYEGCVCIIVNTATKSRLTDIYYKQLNSLMDEFGESQGLRILAFPCNQFDREEPCTSAGIAAHAIDHRVQFDIFAKVNVNCHDAIPLYKFLKKSLGGRKLGDMIKNNYTKFVINRKGIPVERCEANVFPGEMRPMLRTYLKQRGYSTVELLEKTRSRSQDIRKSETMGSRIQFTDFEKVLSSQRLHDHSNEKIQGVMCHRHSHIHGHSHSRIHIHSHKDMEA